ncbi:MAG: 30S ribosomal protein S6 [Candidatus Omnitrophota bacterium]|nr:MAG: 30S ribosomal protein S6 [Candidatus Omnitrophota bacterium]RKY44749.1 MAG: 30S ribosomal protein S6 [Candidatus Omnitrophota bacterium]HDN86446.1 30S ribosomal protein S6 [Candidatus Omnitrophota bacterium]
MDRRYESMIIVRPDIGEEEKEALFTKISEKIKELGGKVLDSKIWAKERKFCYPLRSRGAEKKKYDKGLYWLVKFSLSVEKLANLKETIRLEEKILRNIIIKRERS